MGAASNGATPKTTQVSVTSAAAIVVAKPTGAGQGTGRAGTGVIFKALAGNGQTIFLGDSTVTTSTGFPLAAGDTVSLNVDDPSKVWAVATSGTQTLCLIYL